MGKRNKITDLFARKIKRFHSIQSGNSGILLVTAPPWGVHDPPVGLGYLSAWLGKNGVPFDVFDFNISFYRGIDPKWHKLWLPQFKDRWSEKAGFKDMVAEFTRQIDDAVAEILGFGRPVIGFSVVDPKERMTVEIIKRIHVADPSRRIVLGGPAVSTPEQRDFFLEELGLIIDCYVFGEGEQALLNLMQEYEKSGYEPLGGPSPRIRNEPVEDIDAIPFPTYAGFDLSMYDGGGLTVEWSRGCVGSCIYCKGRDLLGRYRMKNPDKIVSELKWHLSRGMSSHFIVCDNLLNGKVNGLERVCDMIIEEDLPVTWEGQGLPHGEMDLSLLLKMKRAGCLKMQWGLESGSDTVLNAVGKGRVFTVSDASRVIRDCYRTGIETEVFLMVGLPGEGRPEFDQTLHFLKENREHITRIKSVNTLHLIHGTDMMMDPGRFGLFLPEKDWHYMWEADSGNNTYEGRVERTRELISYARELGIEIQEDNLFEGQPSSGLCDPCERDNS